MRTTDGETLSAVNVSQLLSDQQEVLNLRVLSTFSPDPSRIPGEDVTCREWHVNAVGLGGKCFSNCILVNCPCENNATSCQKTPLNSNVNLITTVDGKDGANITLNLAAFGLIAGGHPVVVTYKGSQVIRSTSCTTVEPSRMQVELAKVTLRDFPVTPSSSATAGELTKIYYIYLHFHIRLVIIHSVSQKLLKPNSIMQIGQKEMLCIIQW